MTRLFIRIILSVIFFFISLGSFAQRIATSKVSDSIRVAKPEIIPLADIIGRIGEVEKEIKFIEGNVKPNASIIKIDSLFPVYSKFLQDEKKIALNFIKANPNRQKVNIQIQKWEGYKNNLAGWENSINQFVQKNIILYKDLDLKEKTWELTYNNAIELNAPEELLKIINEALLKYKDPKKVISDRNNYFLTVSSQINAQKITTTEIRAELISLINSDIYNLFYLRHVPLWKTSFKRMDSQSLEKKDSESISQNVFGIIDFAKNNESDIYIFIILIVLIALFLTYLKKFHLKHEIDELDKDLKFSKKVLLDKLVPSIIFISIFSAQFFFTNTPTLFNDLLLLLILIATLPIINLIIHKQFKNVIYLVILFYLLDTAKNYIWFSASWYRVYLLAEGVMVIGTVYYFTHPYLKIIKLQFEQVGFILIKLIPLLYLLAIISITSNVLGYTNLTDVSLKICTRGGIITYILIGFALTLKAVTLSLIQLRFRDKSDLNQKAKIIIKTKTLKILKIFILFFSFIIFLNIVDLLRPIRDFLDDLITEPHIIGTTTITLGAILSFIWILLLSYLITSFISFLFKEIKQPENTFFKIPKGVSAAISLVIRYFIIILAIILSLSSLGIDLSKFNLMAGALGLGIGFGLQTIVSNFISGLILVFERPILVGDTIEVNNLLGTVNRIGVRSSSISTFDGAEVVVPNNNLIANDLINWTLSNNIKRVEILIGTTYNSDPNFILNILESCAYECKDVLKTPPPISLFSDFGESSLNFRLRFWVHYELGLKAKSDVSIIIYNRFKELGVQIPFPQQDIHIKHLPSSIEKDSKA